MATSLKELLDTRANLVAQARDVLKKAETESRELTAEDRQVYDRIDAEIDSLTAKIDERKKDDARRAKLDSLSQTMTEPLPRQVAATVPGSRPAGNDGAASLSFDFGRAGKVNVRPTDALHHRSTQQYADTFGSFLRGEVRDFESLGLVVGSDVKGGYTVPTAFLSQFIKFLDDEVFIRRMATVLPPTTAKSVGAPSYDADPGSADWTAEVPASDISEDDTITLGNRELMPHLLTKMIKVSRKLLRSSTLLADQFLASRLAYKFGITQENAFLTGSGSQRPLGVFTASTSGISTTRDTTCTSTTAFTADELLDLKFSLKAAYQQRATWIVHRDFVKRARKLKDGNGQYLWSAGLSQTMPDMLCDRPYMMSENAPNTFTTGQYIAILGDFSFYWIQDSLGMEIQRLDELGALKNQVIFLARMETDAMPVLEEAFSRLKLA